MAFKIAVSKHFKFTVDGTSSDVDGNPQKFSFGLTAKRLNQDEMDALQKELVLHVAAGAGLSVITEKLKELVIDWSDVKTDDGEPLPFNMDCFVSVMNSYTGMSRLVWTRYQEEAGVKVQTTGAA